MNIYKMHKYRWPADIFYQWMPDLRFTIDKDIEPMSEANFYEVYCEVQKSSIQEVFTF